MIHGFPRTSKGLELTGGPRMTDEGKRKVDAADLVFDLAFNRTGT